MNWNLIVLGSPTLLAAAADALRVKTADHGRKQTRKATNQILDTRPEALKTSKGFSATIEEQDDAPPQLELGRSNTRQN